MNLLKYQGLCDIILVLVAQHYILTLPIATKWDTKEVFASYPSPGVVET